MNTPYSQLITHLDAGGARYRLIDHAPEGRTDAVSALRGNALAAAAKCIVVMIKLSKKEKRYVVAVVPGDARLDLNKLKALFKGEYVGFAAQEIAEQLTGCVAGTILPFSFNPELAVVVDPSLLAHDEIFFNAARLDQSIALAAADYRRLANATEAAITTTAEASTADRRPPKTQRRSAVSRRPSMKRCTAKTKTSRPGCTRSAIRWRT